MELRKVNLSKTLFIVFRKGSNKWEWVGTHDSVRKFLNNKGSESYIVDGVPASKWIEWEDYANKEHNFEIVYPW